MGGQPGSLQCFPNMFVLRDLRCAFPPWLCGGAKASCPCCHILSWLKKSYRGPIDADHHQIAHIGQQQDRSLVCANIVHETEAPFTLSSAARDGLHASYEWF